MQQIKHYIAALAGGIANSPGTAAVKKGALRAVRYALVGLAEFLEELEHPVPEPEEPEAVKPE